MVQKALHFSSAPVGVNFDYRTFYFQIIDLLCSNLEERVSSIDDFSFVDLFKRSNFYEISHSLPMALVQKLLRCYESLLNEARLRSELSFLYSDEVFHLSPQGILVYIHRNGLKPVFPEMKKALQLVLTIHLTTASFERSFSTLKRAKTYLRCNMSEDRLRHLSRISIERQLLSKIESTNVHQKNNKISHWSSRFDFMHK